MPVRSAIRVGALTAAACLLLGLTLAFAAHAAQEPPPASATPDDVNAAPGDDAAAAAGDPVLAVITEARTLANAGAAGDGVALLDDLLVDLEKHDGAGSPALVAPLLVRADLQLAVDDAGGAALSFARAIEIIEQVDGVFSPALVDPLAGLAQAYSRSQRHEEAVTLLRRARHVTHRNHGILNMEQLEIAEQLAESYFKLGMISDANRENRFAFRVNEHEYGANSAELVPAINKLAAWYERIGAFSVARQYYRRSVELLEQNYGENDLRVAEPLRKIARSYLRQDKALREAETSLTRALDIYAANPGADIVEHANSLVELGDWFLVARRRDRAMNMYRAAWDMITEDGAYADRAAPVFGRPTRLRLVVPPADQSLFSGRDQLHVDVQFTVTPEGVVRNVKILGGNADWSLKRAFRTAMHKARYRPRFVDGQPTQTENVVLRYSYQLRKEPVKQASVDRAGDKKIP